MILLSSDEEIDRVLNNDYLQALEHENLISILPPKLKANRPIFLSNVDDYITVKTAEEMSEEIEIKKNGQKKISKASSNFQENQ